MFKKSAVILGLGLLVGCSDTSVSTEPKEAPKPTVSAPAPAAPAKPAAPAAPAAAAPDIKTDIEAYNQMVKGPLAGLTDSLGTFAELNGEAAGDPTVIFTDDWKTDMALTLTLMGEYIGQVEAVNPPAELQEVHDIIIQAMAEYQYVVTFFPQAIDALDAGEINNCTVHMQNGTEYIQEATDKMENMK